MDKYQELIEEAHQQLGALPSEEWGSGENLAGRLLFALEEVGNELRCRSSDLADAQLEIARLRGEE